MINRLWQIWILTCSLVAFFGLNACAAPTGTVKSAVPPSGAVVSGAVTVSSSGIYALAAGDPTTKFGLYTDSYFYQNTVCSIYNEVYATSGSSTTYTQTVGFDSTQFPNTNGYLYYWVYGGVETITGTPPNLTYTVLSSLTNQYSVNNISTYH